MKIYSEHTIGAGPRPTLTDDSHTSQCSALHLVWRLLSEAELAPPRAGVRYNGRVLWPQTGLGRSAAQDRTSSLTCAAYATVAPRPATCSIACLKPFPTRTSHCLFGLAVAAAALAAGALCSARAGSRPRWPVRAAGAAARGSAPAAVAALSRCSPCSPDKLAGKKKKGHSFTIHSQA